MLLLLMENSFWFQCQWGLVAGVAAIVASVVVPRYVVFIYLLIDVFSVSVVTVS